MRRLLIGSAVLLATACSSGQPAPAPAPRATAPAPRRFAPPPARTVRSAPTPAPAYGPAAGAFRWHHRIADAQADARATGRLILVGSTKPSCGLCDKFKNEIVPSVAGQVNSTAVGLMVDTTRPEMAPVWSILKGNLPNARLMPLVGVLTPDLRWLTGFGGPPDANQLLNALATARRMHRVADARPLPPTPMAPRTAATEATYDWSSPMGLAAGEAGDALAPRDPLADAPALPPAPTGALADLPAEEDVRPEEAVAALPPQEVDALEAAEEPASERTFRIPTTPPAPTAGTVGSLEDAPDAPSGIAATSAPMPMTPPGAGPDLEETAAALAAVDPREAPETWGENALELALVQMREGRLEAAKGTLAEIQARVPDSELAREAARGTVALYNVARLDDVEGAARARIVAEARRNLARTMWSGLFGS